MAWAALPREPRRWCGRAATTRCCWLPRRLRPGRIVLVNGIDAWIDTSAGRFAISAQRYAPDVVYPDGQSRLREFTIDPWPRWTFELPDGAVRASRSSLCRTDLPAVALRLANAQCEPARRRCWCGRCSVGPRLPRAAPREPGISLRRPRTTATHVAWQPYDGVPGVAAISNGRYQHEPEWYRNFLYQQERERGLDDTEDLASPGTFNFDLAAGRRGADVFRCRPGGRPGAVGSNRPSQATSACARSKPSGAASSRRHWTARPTPISSSAARGARSSPAIPGSPTGAATRSSRCGGLCLATGRLGEARDILLAWAGTVSEGMLPNRFPDQRRDARVQLGRRLAVVHHRRATSICAPAPRPGKTISTQRPRASCMAAVEAILTGYAAARAIGIRADDDGLLAAGEPGVQLTWMDAKVGDWVVTPRIGKPVEVQALWLNALAIGAGARSAMADAFRPRPRAFRARFWNADRRCLYDVVDCDHQAGRGRCGAAAQSDSGRRRTAAGAAGRRAGPCAWSTPSRPRSGRRWACDRSRPTTAGYRGRYEGGAARPRRRLSPGHGLAVACRAVRRGLGARPRQHRRRPSAKPGSGSCRRWCGISRRPGLGHVSEIADGDAAAHAARLPIPGLVAGRTAAAEQRRVGRVSE